MFNGAYSIALFLLHAELVEAGITLRVRYDSREFWSNDEYDEDEPHSNAHIIDAVFVDDECR
eukprot:11179261-Lingulodinium_polyedra.AAC.1